MINKQDQPCDREHPNDHVHDHAEACTCGHEHAHDHAEACTCGHEHQHDHAEACACGHEHQHNHAEACTCGHEHQHNHAEACTCGHNHQHDHAEACTCGHEHPYVTPIPFYDGELSVAEKRVLEALAHYHFLPIARFTLTSSREEALYVIAMAPVYLVSSEASMEEVREDSAPFASLEQKGLISLDYDIPLAQFDYSLYEKSALYGYFKETVRESAGRPNAIYDTPNLELGSVALREVQES